VNPRRLLTPISGSIDQANHVAARLAGSYTRLFKDQITPSAQTTLAELNAVEADFDGYTPGGLLVPSWTVAVLGPGIGSVVTSATIQFSFTGGGLGVGNVLGGFYLVTADNVLWQIGTFGDPFPMQVVHVGFPLNWLFGYAAA
jgi:hypothetical protein